MDQQLDLDETVEGEFHDVRFDDHDEQTPPNEGRAKTSVKGFENSAIPFEDMKQEQKSFRQNKNQNIQEEVSFISILS